MATAAMEPAAHFSLMTRPSRSFDLPVWVPVIGFQLLTTWVSFGGVAGRLHVDCTVGALNGTSPSACCYVTPHKLRRKVGIRTRIRSRSRAERGAKLRVQNTHHHHPG